MRRASDSGVLAVQFCRTFDGACHGVTASALHASKIRQELMYDIMHLNENSGNVPKQFIQELV
jgi:hypothetical protein